MDPSINLISIYPHSFLELAEDYQLHKTFRQNSPVKIRVKKQVLRNQSIIKLIQIYSPMKNGSSNWCKKKFLI